MTITIRLTQGYSTIIDDIDVDLSTAKWCYTKTGSYAVKKGGKTGLEYLHRIIIERMIGRPLRKREVTDHINRNPLDNRRSNLRATNQSQNVQNSMRRTNNSSGYIGVTWEKSVGKWRAQIRVNGLLIYLGLFSDLKEAARAYDSMARKHFGKFARTNFNE